MTDYFSTNVLPELLKTNLITLRKCRCGIRFDVCTLGFNALLSHKHIGPFDPPNVLVHGHRTYDVHPKSQKFYGLCERCRQKQSAFKQRTQEHKKQVDAVYASKPEVKERKRAREQTDEYKAKKKECNKQYRQTEKGKEKQMKSQAKYNSSIKGKEKRNEYQRHRHRTDVCVRVRQNLSRRLNNLLHKCLNSQLYEKDTMKELGCDMDFFVKHIEDQFEEGMSWDNYGRPEGVPIECTWDLDHITPAEFKENGEEPTVDDIIERSHYTNFQPMWCKQNQAKSNKYKGK